MFRVVKGVAVLQKCKEPKRSAHRRQMLQLEKRTDCFIPPSQTRQKLKLGSLNSKGEVLVEADIIPYRQRVHGEVLGAFARDEELTWLADMSVPSLASVNFLLELVDTALHIVDSVS